MIHSVSSAISNAFGINISLHPDSDANVYKSRKHSIQVSEMIHVRQFIGGKQVNQNPKLTRNGLTYSDIGCLTCYNLSPNYDCLSMDHFRYNATTRPLNILRNNGVSTVEELKEKHAGFACDCSHYFPAKLKI